MRTSVSLYFRVLTSLPLTPRIVFHSPRHAECVIPPGRTGLRKTDGTTDYAIANKLTPFISMQNHHNLVYREEEREMFPTLKVRPKERPSRCALLISSTNRCLVLVLFRGRHSQGDSYAGQRLSHKPPLAVRAIPGSRTTMALGHQPSLTGQSNVSRRCTVTHFTCDH